MSGAVALKQGLLRDAGKDIALAVVWIDRLPSDDEDAARRARVLLDDTRVTQFYDPDKHAGRAWAGVLGLQDVAWDVYLLFDDRAAWGDPAPAPREWFHQLGDDQADPARRRTAHALAQALHGAGRKAGWPVAPEAPEAAQWNSVRDAALARLRAADPDRDGRCADCRAARRVSSCSLGGWRRLVLRQEGNGLFIASGTEPAGDPDGRREVRLAVTGMKCPECMLRAGASALSVKGVDEVEVRLDNGEMRVLIDSSATVRDDDLAAAVRAQGFGATVITRRGGLGLERALGGALRFADGAPVHGGPLYEAPCGNRTYEVLRDPWNRSGSGALRANATLWRKGDAPHGVRCARGPEGRSIRCAVSRHSDVARIVASRPTTHAADGAARRRQC